MRNTTKTMLAIVSLLALGTTAMAASASHKTHRLDNRAAAIQYNARAQAPQLRYDPSAYAFEPAYGSGQSLFDRAKGSIY